MARQTHELAFTEATVTKTFRSWDRGEPDREWDALTLLADRAPGLAPDPLERCEVDGRPAVVMTRLPGTPLADGPLTAAQTESMGAALRRLHAVELGPGDAWPERVNGRSGFRSAVGDWLAVEPDTGPCRDRALVVEAVAAARDWVARPEPPPPGERIPAAADGNLANFLWDGVRCRIVDFEDSGTSDRAFEVADAVEHLTFRADGHGDPRVLVEAAGLPDDQWTRCHDDRRTFACFWLWMLLPGGPGFDRNPPGSVEAQARHLLALLADR